MEVLELKSTITKIKNSLEGLTPPAHALSLCTSLSQINK